MTTTHDLAATIPSDGPTLALACLAELRRMRKHILDAADLCDHQAVAEYADALAEVLEAALS